MSNGSNQHEGDVIVVAQSGPLSGEVQVPGAKNSVLKLMAACLLADGRYTLTNVPIIEDVAIMAELLRAIGLDITMSPAPAGEPPPARPSSAGSASPRPEPPRASSAPAGSLSPAASTSDR